jgi:hypothetical protein
MGPRIDHHSDPIDARRDRDRAVVEAQRKVGRHCKFAVTQTHTLTSGTVTKETAVVTAYNDQEIRTIPIDQQQ